MSKRDARSPFSANYYPTKTQDHATYLSIVDQQNDLFLTLGEAAVNQFRKRLALHTNRRVNAYKMAAHEWFGYSADHDEVKLVQMTGLIEEIFAKNEEGENLFEEMVDLQHLMSAPSGKTTWLGAQLKEPQNVTDTDYWMRVDNATNTQLPTLNNLKRLSIHIRNAKEKRAFLNTLQSHGIRSHDAHGTKATGPTSYCSFLPGLNYNPEGYDNWMVDVDYGAVTHGYPCVESSVSMNEGIWTEDPMHTPCAYVGRLGGFTPADGSGEQRWGVFYHSISGLFVALIPMDEGSSFPLSAPPSAGGLSHVFGNKMKHEHQHTLGIMELQTAPEGWNNLLAPTLQMRLIVGDGDTWASPRMKPNTSDYWDALTRSLGATIFYRMMSDTSGKSLTLETPPYLIEEIVHGKSGGGKDFDPTYIGLNYTSPVFTKGNDKWEKELDKGPMAEFIKRTAKVSFIDSWADKRETLTLNQGDGRYYHNIIRCSVCNGRVQVTLGKIPPPDSPLKCPHCEHDGLRIDMIFWKVKQ